MTPPELSKYMPSFVAALRRQLPNTNPIPMSNPIFSKAVVELREKKDPVASKFFVNSSIFGLNCRDFEMDSR